MIMSANNDQEINAVIQALKKYIYKKITKYLSINLFLYLDIVQIKLNLLIIILVHQ